jgi:putative Mg2+ transporter-C (MgtC) family protein
MIPSTEEAIMRVGWALLMGAIVGFEREWTQKSAGLRTHILVCMGSAIFTLISVSDWLFTSTLPSIAHQLPAGVVYSITRDPGRIAAQIVTGIGFIGGGALLHYGNNVRGVTTAASLWIMASIGMLAGLGAYSFSFVCAVMCFLVLFSLGKVERVFFRKQVKVYDKLELLVLLEADQQEAVSQWLKKFFRQRVLHHTLLTPTTEGNLVELQVSLNIKGMTLDWPQWRQRLEKRQGVRSTGLRFLND